MSLLFDLPEIKCKYMLDNAQYGSLDELLQEPFKPCKVGKKEGECLEPYSRLSKYIDTDILFENHRELNSLITDKIEELIGRGLDVKKYLDFNINNTYKVLKYQKGDFFLKHQDTITKDLHYGTLLIFPPSIGTLEHTGGKLVFDDTEFDSSTNKRWKAIIMYCETFHEIEKITSGQRIVFKTKLFLNESFDSDLDQSIYSDLCDGGMNDHVW